MPKHEIIISSDVPGVDEGLRSFLCKVIRTALDAEEVDVPCEINVLVTNDTGIHRVNLEMRNVDAPTDVLSFPMFELTPGDKPSEEDADPATGLVPLGDMCISLERAKAQAEEYGHGPERELAYLAVHSVLHLLGYDHLDEGPMKAQMRGREEAIMAELGLEREKIHENTLRYAGGSHDAAAGGVPGGGGGRDSVPVAGSARPDEGIRAAGGDGTIP